jgi:hypothetical protein
MSTPNPTVVEPKKEPTDYGYFGPNYSVTDDIKLPGDLGVRQESSFAAIFDSVGGINYYLDTIAFGSATGFDKGNPYPLGIRYYLDTGVKCSNGSTMNEYVDGVTKGDLLGERVAKGLASSGLPGMKGLAPGMLENARDALDPRPIFTALSGTGYPVCQQVLCPVGTTVGKIQASDAKKPFIVGPIQVVNGLPHQKRWVQAYTDDGYAISVSKDEYNNSLKCYNPDGTYMARPPEGCPPTEAPASSGPSSGSKYRNCIQTQREVMPPPPPTKEGFMNPSLSVTGLLIIGIAVLLLMRNR